jgi:hypothetical protein
MTNTFCPHPGGLFKPPALPVVMTSFGGKIQKNARLNNSRDIRLRMPIHIHKGITDRARIEGKSLNRSINEMLEAVIAQEMS